MKRIVLGACVVLVAASAQANPRNPPIIKNHLGLVSAPPCTLCHETLSGGEDTVVTPFGMATHDFGLEGDTDEAGVIAILDQMEAENVDSDGDGKGDIAELREGGDPNVANPQAQADAGTTPPTDGSGDGATPDKGGCSAAGFGALPSLFMLGLLALLRRRKSGA